MSERIECFPKTSDIGKATAMIIAGMTSKMDDEQKAVGLIGVANLLIMTCRKFGQTDAQIHTLIDDVIKVKGS